MSFGLCSYTKCRKGATPIFRGQGHVGKSAMFVGQAIYAFLLMVYISFFMYHTVFELLRVAILATPIFDHAHLRDQGYRDGDVSVG